MYSKKLLFVMVFLLALNLAAFAQQKQSDIQKLSQKADVVLKGKVMKKNSDWNENKTRIYTKVTLRVDEYIKGNQKQPTIEVVYPGGEVGDVGEFYTHTPTFEAEEEVILFLKKNDKKNRFEVLHGQDGKIKIIRENNK